MNEQFPYRPDEFSDAGRDRLPAPTAQFAPVQRFPPEQFPTERFPTQRFAPALFHSLSDGTRLSIIRRLAHGETRVADLVAEVGLAQSTVSAHVACLRDCGLVEGRPEGRQVFYSLARPELIDLLASAETLLAATGSAVALCPDHLS